MKDLRSLLAIAVLASAPVIAADLPEGVIVKQGSADVTFDELDARVSEIPAKDRDGFMDSPQRIETVLRQLLLTEQLANEAIERKLDQSPQFKAQLDLARKRLLAQMRNDQVLEEGPKIDAQALVEEVYLSEPERFTLPEHIAVRHILITTKSRMETDAKAQVEALRDEIASGKASFADVAQRESEDKTTAQRGGLIENIKRGMTDPDFETAAFSLTKPGELVIAQSKFGIHLIQLVSRDDTRRLSKEEAVAQFTAQFEADAKLRYQQEYVQRVQSAALEADPDRVASLRERYADKAAAKAPAKKE